MRTPIIVLRVVSPFLLLLSSASAQYRIDPTTSEIGIPFIHNYTPKEYNYANAQNWSLAQNQRGVIYVANWDGVLEYDGQSWRSFAIPNKNTRSVASALLFCR